MLAIALLLSSPGLLVRARITKPLKLHVLHFNDVHNRIKAATTSYVGHPPLLLPPDSISWRSLRCNHPAVSPGPAQAKQLTKAL